MPRCQTVHAAVLPLLVAAGALAPAALPRVAGAQTRDGDADWVVETRARADVGYDTNVFQADSARDDGYTAVGGVVEVGRDLGRTQLDAFAEAGRKLYWRFSQADETELFVDLAATREQGAIFGGLALRSAYIDMRFLDREGNLLPRATFASLSNRLLAFGDVRLSDDLYLAAEAGYRLKDYEETAGLTSLDYGEWSAELDATRYFPRRLSLRLQGTLEVRDYQGRRAADAGGFLDPDNPALSLRRLEAEARLRKRWAREGLVELTTALRSSDDLFEGELSYDQRSAGVRVRQPVAGSLLRLTVGLTDRDFELRRSGTGEPLEETFFNLEGEAERAVGGAARMRAAYGIFHYATNDLQGGYSVGTFRLGVAYEF